MLAVGGKRQSPHPIVPDELSGKGRPRHIPEYEHRWASKTANSQLRLDTLPAESAAEQLAALLGPDPGLAPLTQMLVKRGNPFFLEETVRTLVEAGARGVPADAAGGGSPDSGHGADDPGGAHRPAAQKKKRLLQHLTKATTMFGEMDMRFWREQAEAEVTTLM
jgi:hypothetical protein